MYICSSSILFFLFPGIRKLFKWNLIFIYAVKSIFSVTVSPTRVGTWSWSLLVLSAQQVQYIFNE